MDRRVQSDVTPAMSQLRLDFSKDNLLPTMKTVEMAYWDYLDNYNAINRRRYPYIRMSSFLIRVMENNGLDTTNAYTYCKIYDRYKKSLPTAGILLYYNDTIPKFIVIRMKTAKIWSMPKGKKDNAETIDKTATREFREETGIDLEDLITDSTPKKTIHKTLFYIVEADHMQQTFNGFNVNEIADVKWVSAQEVLSDTFGRYSRQTVAAAETLTQLL